MARTPRLSTGWRARSPQTRPEALVAVFEQFEEERREGERFHEWARRKRNAELREALRKPVRSGCHVAGFDIRDMMNDIDEAPARSGSGTWRRR